MISHEHKCIHIHIPKCAGTAITRAMHDDGRHKHMRAVEYKNLLQDDYYSYYSFAFVRNPYERVVSYYEMCKRNSFKGHTEQIKKCTALFGGSSFHHWVKYVEWINDDLERMREFGLESIYELAPQVDWVCDDAGDIIVDDIFFFEKLPKSYNHACDKAGISGRKNKLRKKNSLKWMTPNRSTYKPYYNKRAVDVIARVYHKDFETFNYAF